MPLDDDEKRTAKQTLALLLDANEPEELVSALRLMCSRKTDDKFISDRERERWAAAAQALTSVEAELVKANAPKPRLDEPAQASA